MESARTSRVENKCCKTFFNLRLAPATRTHAARMQSDIPAAGVGDQSWSVGKKSVTVRSKGRRLFYM